MSQFYPDNIYKHQGHVYSDGMNIPAQTVTAFRNHQRLASGEPNDVVRIVAQASLEDPSVILIFDDLTGRQIDLDLRAAPVSAESARESAPARGRPRLGVAAREVTLLPRHWDWLATQPGGASATLRKLVEAASREARSADRARVARDAAYHAMSALAGDLPGFEAASRALFAGDLEGFGRSIRDWPTDVTAYILGLASVGEGDIS